VLAGFTAGSTPRCPTSPLARGPQPRVAGRRRREAPELDPGRRPRRAAGRRRDADRHRPGGRLSATSTRSRATVADLSFRDFHKIRTADYTARQLRSRLEAEYKGQKNTGNFIDRVRTSANAILNELVAREILVGHNPADASADPATGTITYVQAPVVLPDTNKFILLTVALQPASALAPTS
jgi:hypothetical protein